MAARAAPSRALAVGVAAAVAIGALILDRLPAAASYSAQAVGAGKAKAATLVTPAAPIIVSTTNVLGLFCQVVVNWPAPPGGQQYTVRRTVGANTVVVAGPTSSAGPATDNVLLSSLTSAPVYQITSTLTGTSWSVLSPTSTATGCMSLI